MRDPKVEQVLDSTPNIDWEYRSSILIASINIAKSHRNQVRIRQPLIPDRVKAYAEAMANGDEFPAPVLFLDSDEYVTSDGNQRIAAKQSLERDTTDGYVVVCSDPVTRARLTYEWNTLNGDPGPDMDHDQHAIDLASQGLTAKEIAKTLHVSSRRVEDVLAEDKGHNRAIELGVKSPWAKIVSRHARVKLHRGLALDQPFAAAVKYAASFALTGDQVRDFVVEVIEFRTEAEQVNFISQRNRERSREVALAAKEKAGRRGGNAAGPSPYARYKAHVEYLSKHSVPDEFAQAIQFLNDEEREELATHMNKTIARMASAVAVLEGTAVPVPQPKKQTRAKKAS